MQIPPGINGSGWISTLKTCCEFDPESVRPARHRTVVAPAYADNWQRWHVNGTDRTAAE
jgi:hypothetical protein